MNNIKKSYLILVAICMFAFSSCDQYFGDTNLDPNNPTKVPSAVLLPSIQVRLAYLIGGDASRYTSIYTQHVDGVSRQFTVIQSYGIQPSDVNTMWGPNIYAGILQDINKLKSLSDSDPLYVGIGKCLEAYTMMITTDLFGDVPYSEALQGLENLSPAFDSQESIYTAIQNLLDEAINDLSQTTGLAPGSDDVIYGGDVSLWTKFAYTLKARGYLHIGLVSNANYNNALNALSNGFTSSADDAYLQFGDAATENAPWYQYNNDRNDIAVGATYVQYLDTLSDPRKAYYGATLEAGHPYFVPNQAHPILTYTEVKFIEAECRMQTEGATAATHQAFLDGIQSSFDHLGITNTTYTQNPEVNPGASALTMDEIMLQKYLALFTDPEVFNDWRRTGIPALTPNTGSEVPVRLPYPEDEINYNSNCPATTTIYNKVWWDQN
jgi:hypothetical protein